jgi:hypothetical protein
MDGTASSSASMQRSTSSLRHGITEDDANKSISPTYWKIHQVLETKDSKLTMDEAVEGQQGGSERGPPKPNGSKRI